MGLSDRKKKILSCVVESYIADGEAVGSKTLQAALDFEVSSATIRNEMAALEICILNCCYFHVYPLLF